MFSNYLKVIQTNEYLFWSILLLISMLLILIVYRSIKYLSIYLLILGSVNIFISFGVLDYNPLMTFNKVVACLYAFIGIYYSYRKEN